MKKIIFSVVTLILVIVFIAITAEVAFRIKDLFDKNRGLRNSMGDVNRKYDHAFKPNSRFRLVASKNNEYNVAVEINNYAFRGKDIRLNKDPGVTRILVMGDSFTFGVGAEENETIPFLIEKYLKEKGKKVEIVNAGFGSDSPILHYLKVKEKYLKFKPDLALFLFDFSDLSDDWRYERSLVYDESGNIIRCDPAFIDGKRDWWKTARMHSKLCVYIHNKIVRLIEKIRILGFRNYIKAKMEGKRAKALIVEKQAEDKRINPIKYDGYLMIRGGDRLDEIKKHLKRTEKYLTLLRDALKEDGIPLVLIVYPYGIHVGPDQWGEGRVYWGFEKDKIYDDYYAFDLMGDYAKENNIPFINTLPVFLENNDKKLFFDIDGHFTPETNKIVAKDIVNNKTFIDVLNGIQAD